jgi:hypothetical protein
MDNFFDGIQVKLSSFPAVIIHKFAVCVEQSRENENKNQNEIYNTDSNLTKPKSRVMGEFNLQHYTIC